MATYPYVAPHTAKIHTLITLGIRHGTKPPVLKARKHRPCGFDSHRPLHSTARICIRLPDDKFSGCRKGTIVAIYSTLRRDTIVPTRPLSCQP